MEMMNMIAAKRLLDGFTTRLTTTQASLTSLRRADLERTPVDGLDLRSLSTKLDDAKNVFREALEACLVVNVEMQVQARRLVLRPGELAELLQSNAALLDAAKENLALRKELEREERERTQPGVDLVAEAIAQFKRELGGPQDTDL